MQRDGSCLPPGWGSWLALLLWGSLFYFLLGAASPLHGQTQSDRLASIERELTYSLATCARLSDVQKGQSAKLASLSVDLAALRVSLGNSERKLDDLENELKDSKALSVDLQQEVLRLRDLLKTLQVHLDELSETFERYKAAQTVVVKSLERQVTGWKVLAVVLGAALAGVTVYAAVK